MPLNKLTTCLWFDDSTKAEEAAKAYTTIFPNSEIKHTARYMDAGSEHHGHKAGDVMMISFTLDGHAFTILNGGKSADMVKSGAVSFMIDCQDQEEVDHFFNELGKDGPEEKKVCGWLTDKWGTVWQIVPKQLIEFMQDPDKEKVGRVTVAMMGMKKMDIEGLRKAYEGS